MCGRYSLKHAPAHLKEHFNLTGGAPEFYPRYNVAPSQEAPVVGVNPKTHSRSMVPMHWGLVPFWAKDPAIGNKMINARSEGIDAKVAFKDSLKKRRCIVPVSGFYEWRKEGAAKQPYYFYLPEDEPMGLAGLWAEWDGPEGKLLSYTIITTKANKVAEAIHERMPVILPPEAYGVWLDPSQPVELLIDLLLPYAGELKCHPVSRAINRPVVDSPDLIQVVPLNSA